MLGLETCFQVINTLFPDAGTNQLVDLFSHNNRQMFKLDPATIQPGSDANITLFKRDPLTNITSGKLKSKSRNSAFIGQQLKGVVIGIINKDQLYLNDLN